MSNEKDPDVVASRRRFLVGSEWMRRELIINGIPGDRIDIESCVAQLGGSSLRLYHRVRNSGTGEYIAGLSQFGVQLDLDARRPSRIADDIRARAQALGAG